jgi:type II secretory pathway pseudopilin PulG
MKIMTFSDKKQPISFFSRVREAVRNERGALDLGSIMVGVVVVGVLSSIIAATVFVVIPWGQDNAAKQLLSNVYTAQETYAGANEGVYTSDLTGYLQGDISKIALRSNNNDVYAAFTTSSTGAVFYNSSDRTEPSKIGANDPWPAKKPADYPAALTWPTIRTGAQANLAPNLVLNPSVESGTENYAGIGNANKTAFRVNSASAYSGSSILRVTRDSSNGFQTAGLGYGAFTSNLEPGTYVVSVRVRSSAPISVRSYNEGSATRSSVIVGPTIALTGSWQTIYSTITISSTGTIKVGFLQTSTAVAGDSVEMDSFMAVRSSGNLERDITYEG